MFNKPTSAPNVVMLKSDLGVQQTGLSLFNIYVRLRQHNKVWSNSEQTILWVWSHLKLQLSLGYFFNKPAFADAISLLRWWQSLLLYRLCKHRLKQYSQRQNFKANMPATSDSHFCTCLGHLGHLETNRNYPICFCRPRGLRLVPGNTKGGSITVPLTSCLTGLD